MKLSTILIALVLFTGVILGTYTFINDLASPTAYNVAVDQSYVEDFNKSISLQNEINAKYDKIQNLSANTGSAFQIITLVPDALSILKDVVTLPFTTAYSVVNSITQNLSLPTWFNSLILSIIAALLIFAILGAILRYQV